MIQLLIITLILTQTKSDFISKNDSSVIMTFGGHVEAADSRILPPKTDTTEKPTTENATFGPEEDKESVVFVPNDKPENERVIDDDYLHDELVKVHDVLESRRTVGDIVSGKFVEEPDTEQPPGDIMFISGKNTEHLDKPIRKEEKGQKHTDFIGREGTEKETPKVKLDCKNLDCNNSKNAVCGGKLDNRTWKYRLFLNDCFFRKVNCNFMYDSSRYSKVPLHKCKDIGAHYSERPSVYIPMAPPSWRQNLPVQRRSSGRRANNMNIDGSMCAHACPTTCTEEYDPECGVSSVGVRRVFTNHCALDLHSCTTFTGLLR